MKNNSSHSPTSPSPTIISHQSLVNYIHNSVKSNTTNNMSNKKEEKFIEFPKQIPSFKVNELNLTFSSIKFKRGPISVR